MTELYLVIIFLVLVGFGASFVQRVSGFGLGIFAMIFLPSFMPSVVAAATVSCLFSCGTATYNAVKFRKSISFRAAIPMLIASLITLPIAIYFAARIHQELFKMLLGVLLILLSIFFLFFNRKIRMRATPINGLLAGSISGVLSGLFSTGGPPVVLYLSSLQSDKVIYFATIQFFFCVTNIYSIATRALNGLITPLVLGYAAIGLVGCILGNFVGKLVFNRLDGEKLKLIIYVGMILSGILMIL